jgi:hypothetical protein
MPDRIIISSGFPNSKKLNNELDSVQVQLKNFIAFDLNTNTLYFKKKERKKWKSFTTEVNKILTDTNTYKSLDSAYKQIRSFDNHGEKQYWFKIRLEYRGISKNSPFPMKNKEIIFVGSLSRNIPIQIPNIVLLILDEYFRLQNQYTKQK